MKPIALTMGDPAGIGGELTLRAWLARGKREPVRPSLSWMIPHVSRTSRAAST